MIKERLAALKAAMKEADIDCYIIPTSDYHNSEYVSEYFMVRKYFSGFTGSAGTLVVLKDKAALFTDGRYFIQAAKQLQGSDITLMKMGEPKVPTLEEYVRQELKEGENIGFDGRVITAGDGLAFEKTAMEKGGKVIFHLDLAEKIWKDRPALLFTPVFVLKEEYSGESCDDKLKRLREKMKEEGAAVHLLTTLDDIAWLFNLRAKDVESCPVLLSYAVITMDEAILFAGERAFDETVRKYLAEHHITLKPYDDFYTYVADLVKTGPKEKLLVCENRINYRLKKELGDAVIVDRANPTTLMKAVKNSTEQENLRKVHLMDGVAVTKFMYWLKTNVGKVPMTEVSASDYLESLRGSNPTYIEPSFATICAYGANGAIIHYTATPESYSEIQAKGMLMVDSGGHYYEGSTDITRTFVLGEITEEMRQHFTLVARAMLRLKSTKFLYGCKGVNLDLAAREVFWEKGLDYKHGTGHGVGYLLNVHEGPNSFRYKVLPGSDNDWIFEEGMVTTDEPGIYIEGSHGVRIENELLCRKGENNEYGQFMEFEDLTYVPIDLDGLDVSAMENSEIQVLNRYHRTVYEKLAPFFDGEELEWLKNATREI
ncbi:MAG: aminopeptidase P family protein [Lachnospiraceae bacterium]|nr:aminopeptidase P family protein [Lachnospiraceae bacterium]MDD7629222.1 aminopeptidase P family protein [Lachnospiraceae bacterium]MDY4118015.1 aminopeptidase P family protein [Lachnospiraceae bacterium]